MQYWYQRIEMNDNNWKSPSMGRLNNNNIRSPYVRLNGFGHEDWNFNLDLHDNNYIYGYCNADLTRNEEHLNIAFVRYNHSLQSWHLVGFYNDCETNCDGYQLTDRIIFQKARSLFNIREALSNQYEHYEFSDFVELIRNDIYFNVKVHVNNVKFNTNQTVIPKFIKPHSFHFNRFEDIPLEKFENLLSLTTDYIVAGICAVEGNERWMYHKVRERNQRIIQEAKRLFRQQDPNHQIYCQICSFSFETRYPNIGENFVEAHHIDALAANNGFVVTNLNDLLLVCSNCHRMLHRNNCPGGNDGIEYLRNLIIQHDPEE